MGGVRRQQKDQQEETTMKNLTGKEKSPWDRKEEKEYKLRRDQDQMRKSAFIRPRNSP